MTYPRSISRRAFAEGEAGARLVVRLAYAAAFADLVTAARIQSRGEAEGWRRRAALVFEPLLEVQALSETEHLALRDLYGKLCEYLVRAALDLAPLMRISAPDRLPSVLLAWQIYGDPLRAADLVDRNAVSTPFFMPILLEAERHE